MRFYSENVHFTSQDMNLNFKIWALNSKLLTFRKQALGRRWQHLDVTGFSWHTCQNWNVVRLKNLQPWNVTTDENILLLQVLLKLMISAREIYVELICKIPNRKIRATKCLCIREFCAFYFAVKDLNLSNENSCSA